jgi:uncharacterized caspase-like protein
MCRFLTKAIVRPAAILAVAGLCSLPGCGDIFKSDDDSDKTNYAVIVGISNYQSSSLNLKWAEEDALDVYDALRASKGWESDNITLLTNSSATRDGIKSALAGLAKRVGPNDHVLFYFSGRGSYGPDEPPFDEEDGLDEYLVPYDGLTNTTARDLSDDALEGLLTSLPTDSVLVIIDAGFSGPGSRAPLDKEKFVLRPVNGRSIAPRNVDGMSHEFSRPGFTYISAAQDGAAPCENSQLRNGVFTYYFVEGMRGAANPSRKAISAQQAFEYAAPRVSMLEPGQVPQFTDKQGKKYALTAR